MLTVGLGLDDDNDALDFVIEVKHFVLDLNIFSSLSERSSKAERSVAEVGAAGLCLLILVGVFFTAFPFFFVDYDKMHLESQVAMQVQMVTNEN